MPASRHCDLRARGSIRNTVSAPLSPIMIAAALMLPQTTVGLIEASTDYRVRPNAAVRARC
jgi:hypothetical protein